LLSRYQCYGSAAGDIRYASRRVEEGKRANRPVKRKLGRIIARYRKQAPPADVLAEYNALLRKHKAQVREINRRIREHNRILKDDCS